MASSSAGSSKSENGKKKSWAKCSFVGCGRTQQTNPDLHFFRFPVKRPDILEQWLINCGNECLIELSNNSLYGKRVCEKHFTPACFLNDMRKLLKKEAVPTLLHCDPDRDNCETVTTNDSLPTLLHCDPDRDNCETVTTNDSLPTLLHCDPDRDNCVTVTTNDSLPTLLHCDPDRDNCETVTTNDSFPTVSSVKMAPSSAGSSKSENGQKKSWTKCSFVGCGRTHQTNPDLHFFRFPVKRPDILEQWLINCGNESLIELSNNSLYGKRVCEKHFTPACFLNDMRKLLKKEAVPTLLQGDSDPDYCETVTTNDSLPTLLHCDPDRDNCETVTTNDSFSTLLHCDPDRDNCETVTTNDSLPTLLHCDPDRDNCKTVTTNDSLPTLLHCDPDRDNCETVTANDSFPTLLHCDPDRDNCETVTTNDSLPTLLHCDPYQGHCETVTTNDSLVSSDISENKDDGEVTVNLEELELTPSHNRTVAKSQSSPQTPSTPLYKKYKPITHRTPTPRKKKITPIRRKLLNQLKESQRKTEKFQTRAKRLTMRKRAITKDELATALKDLLPPAVSNFVVMQLNRANAPKKLCSTDERRLALSVSCKSPRTRKAAAEASSACNQDDSSSAQGFDPGPSTSGGNMESINIKEEGIKEELMLEDYGDPSHLMDYQAGEETGAIGVKAHEELVDQSSSSMASEGPFETIICGTSDVQIKQEIFEDESDLFNNTEPHSSGTPQFALPSGLNAPNIPFQSTMTSQVPNVPFQTTVTNQVPNVPFQSTMTSQVHNVPFQSIMTSQVPNVPFQTTVTNQVPNIPFQSNMTGQILMVPFQTTVTNQVPNVLSQSTMTGQVSNVPFQTTATSQIPNIPFQPNMTNQLPNVSFQTTATSQIPTIPFQPNMTNQLPNVPFQTTMTSQEPNVPFQPTTPTQAAKVPFQTTVTNQVQPPPKKCTCKAAPTSTVGRSQVLKGVPALSLEKCQICSEVFSSPSDLVEHCILKHSDASSKFLPDKPPMEDRLKMDESLQGLHSPKSQSGATTPGLSVANPPGQPPKQWIPPYITACDVFDGVFVSLRNIPAGSRKATRDKILELVSFVAKENVDPRLVNFSLDPGLELNKSGEEPARCGPKRGRPGIKSPKNEPQLGKSGPKRAKTGPKPAMSESEPERSRPKRAKTGPKPARPEPETVRSGPKLEKIESAEPGPARFGEEPAKSEPEPVRSEPEPEKIEPPEPGPNRFGAEPAKSEPEPARSEPEPARSEPEPARSEPESEKIEPPEPGTNRFGEESARSEPEPARSEPKPKSGPEIT